MTVKVITVLNSNRYEDSKTMERWLYKGASRYRQTLARQDRTLTSGDLVASGSASPSKITLSSKNDPEQTPYSVMLAFD
jgi:hypothetical protein